MGIDNVPNEAFLTGAAKIEEIQNPSVGRDVHYVAYGSPGGEFPAGVCRTAKITEVGVNGQMALCIFNPTGLFFNVCVEYDPTCSPGTWHWPERV